VFHTSGPQCVNTTVQIHRLCTISFDPFELNRSLQIESFSHLVVDPQLVNPTSSGLAPDSGVPYTWQWMGLATPMYRSRLNRAPLRSKPWPNSTMYRDPSGATSMSMGDSQLKLEKPGVTDRMVAFSSNLISRIWFLNGELMRIQFYGI
jgi:hypothetical protein